MAIENNNISFDAIKEIIEKLKMPDAKGYVILPDINGLAFIEMDANKLRAALHLIYATDKTPDIKMRNESICLHPEGYLWSTNNGGMICTKCDKNI